MKKSKLEHYECQFIRSVQRALDELLEVSGTRIPTSFVARHAYSIEGYSPDEDKLYTLVFKNLGGVIIGYLDYEKDVGITGYELSDIDENQYISLAGYLLAWESETLFHLQETK